MPLEWKKFDEKTVTELHGNVYYYRKLYEGRHSEIFERAKELIEKGEIVDNIINGVPKTANVKTPYIVANICKLIPEIPAMLVSRSIGTIQTSVSPDDFQNDEVNEETDDMIDGPADGTESSKIIHAQQEVVRQIENNSKLTFEHWGNIVQQQVDGGLVGVPWLDDAGLRIEFKARDVYFPHEDGMGVDLVYRREIDEKDYLQVYRERVERGNGVDMNLRTSHLLYELNASNEARQLPDPMVKQLLGMNELEKVYIGRGRPFVIYWPNQKTFINQLGVSCLKNQEGKQDEINWTLTRNSLTFERNGKPRIAVSPEVMRALQDKAMERYGDEGRIDHRDLEITTFDDKGKALEVIQIDVTKIGDIGWVKDLIKLVLMETQTSEKMIDFYSDVSGSTGAAQSGVAKFYDLFVSLLKAEQIQQEYIYFLQQLFESALWIQHELDPAIIIEEPEVQIKSMIPISRKELVEENNKAYTDGTQSLEVTIRRNNPTASEEWVMEELARVEAEHSSADSFSTARGFQTLENFYGNRDENMNPIGDEE
ncbi:hypothetical protein [Sporosarcina sp. FSL K6-3508]|uniref:hypothetical protein n=1 Tax=Sporosarcina sp. FSL K6-3508 TaxID=2921557 RepID=UPI003159B5A7